MVWLTFAGDGVLVVLAIYLALDFRKFLKTDNRWDDFM